MSLSGAQGKKLAERKGVRTFRCAEFKLTPKKEALKYNFSIDGDPFDCSTVHAQNLHLAITCFVGAGAMLDPAEKSKKRWRKVPKHVRSLRLFQRTSSNDDAADTTGGTTDVPVVQSPRSKETRQDSWV